MQPEFLQPFALFSSIQARGPKSLRHRGGVEISGLEKTAMIKLLKSLLVIGSVTLCAAGCATGPSYSQYRSTLSPPREGYGRIWFYRPTVLAAEVQPVIKLDDRIVGHAVPQGFFRVDVPAGVHEVSATSIWKHSAIVTVSTNNDTYIRFTPLFGIIAHHFVPEEVDDSLGPNSLHNLRLAIR